MCFCCGLLHLALVFTLTHTGPSNFGAARQWTATELAFAHRVFDRVTGVQCAQHSEILENGSGPKISCSRPNPDPRIKAAVSQISQSEKHPPERPHVPFTGVSQSDLLHLQSVNCLGGAAVRDLTGEVLRRMW